MDWLSGSLALEEALSIFVGVLGRCLAAGSSNSNSNHRSRGNNLGSRSNFCTRSTQVKRISSIRHDVPGFSWKSKHRELVSSVSFHKISSVALKQIRKEAERFHSCALMSLVQPFCNVISNVVSVPFDSEEERCVNQEPCEIVSRGCGPCTELNIQNLASAKTIEPRTGVEFPSVLDNGTSGESNPRFIPEVLVGSGSRTATILRIKTLRVYAFGFYVDPLDVCDKLGSKYAGIPENELIKRHDFYQDLLREDISMTIRLVVNFNGVKINTVKDVFGNSLRARLEKANPNADLSCVEQFGSMFPQDMPINVGTIINFRRTTDGQLITQVGGNHIGAIHSKDLCRALFDMYIGDVPICEKTKEEIGKNLSNIVKMC